MVTLRRALFCLSLLLPLPPGMAQAAGYSTPEALGEALFFDTALSKNRTQACATCHDPAAAFTDPRQTKAGGQLSLGDDGQSFGNRHTPSAAYARYSPPFSRSADGVYSGGQFHDGRAATLEDQAGGPPLNPKEMGMTDKAAVRDRLAENPAYAAAFPALFGPGTLDNADTAYTAMTRAIAAYERTKDFATFDSRYDRALRGELTLTPEEELGRTLFFSNQFTNCRLCHQLQPQGGMAEETFSNYQFHNIGVPANPQARRLFGYSTGQRDTGLAENPAVKDKAAQTGKFKVPTLRNVAVTAPYMHNGVFKDLRTVILFYNTFNTRNPKRKINPETGQPFASPEFPGTVSLKELESGPALDDKRINALVAFLRALTDQRYEALLPPL
ncbi:cytochrome-c peroxidase [Novispirillum itersonii]|uniref:cytochrome-c peroxidase n=1 Tax=Novispirillum itersonii TaxID=189 RepID=UPI00036ED370|nr:cytochrome c peroxidase [Novispirillum itersonii]